MGVVVADACESIGLKMASLSERTRRKLREISASWVNISNPVDMSAIAPLLGPLEAYRAVVEILLQDEGTDVVVPIILASARVAPEKYDFLPELSARYPLKTLYVSFTGDKQVYDRAKAFIEERSVPVFYPLEDAFETLAVVDRCRQGRAE